MRQTFDRRSVLGLAVGSAAGAVFVSSAKPTYAAGTAYKATLDGKSEVPPTTSTGTGTATVTYDPATKMVTWEGSFSGLSGPATAAHIHGPGEAGKNAGVIVPLSQKGRPSPVRSRVRRHWPMTRPRRLRRRCRPVRPMSTSTPRRTPAVSCAANWRKVKARWVVASLPVAICVTRRSCVSWTGGYYFVCTGDFRSLADVSVTAWQCRPARSPCPISRYRRACAHRAPPALTLWRRCRDRARASSGRGRPAPRAAPCSRSG